MTTRKVLPEIPVIFDGLAIRAPVPVVSIADLVFLPEIENNSGAIKSIFEDESKSEGYREILGICEDEFISSEFGGDSRASMMDLDMVQVVAAIW